MKRRFQYSIKRTVLLFDFVIVVPLFLLFCILTIAVFQKSNYEWNKSKLSAIEERCSNISARNTEIVKITNMLYLDFEINQILSQKTKLTGYEKIQANDKIQKKMTELTELFPERQYQIMILCSNGSSYFQNSLGVLEMRSNLKTCKKNHGTRRQKRKGMKFISCPNTEAHC